MIDEKLEEELVKIFEERYEEKASYSNNIPTTSTTRR